ncbi:MAG: endonuclease/exonuclease/phosphatase family protein [Pseudomonadota bacterium]
MSIAFWLVAICLIATAFLPELADRSWLFDLASNLRLPIIIAAAILAIAALSTRRYLIMLVAIGSTVPHLMAMTVHWPEPQPQGGRPISVGTANLLWNHEDPANAVALLSDLNLDLLVVQEKSTQWNTHLRPLRERYQFTVPGSPAFSHDVMVFSRWPVVSVTPLAPGSTYRSGMIVELVIDDHTLTVIGVHAPTPTSARLTDRRDAFLNRIAEEVQARRGNHVLVVGDFNATPYAPSFQILAEAGLSADASSGTPIATWPTWLPLVGLPIDHVLGNDRIAIGTVETGPDIGSDHYPLIAHVRLLD